MKTRVERATAIRDQVLSVDDDEWSSLSFSNHVRSVLHRDGFRAMLWIPGPAFFHANPREDSASTFRWPKYDWRLDLWVPLLGNVLALGWVDREPVTVISMKRGDWESDLFGLSAWVPRKSRRYPRYFYTPANVAELIQRLLNSLDRPGHSHPPIA